MGNDPNSFIKQIIINLNSGNTGGQTFDSTLSTDYQASKLELSQKINGISVYNFALAKVRYRALTVSATDVRVFFRMFPVANTSLAYNQAITYRRGGQAGVTIPLLGISNGEVVAIPCFAEERIDSSTTNMNSQIDPSNVQTLPPNNNGDEVVRYFGCLLDINQTQSQFPIQPSPPDGPYTSSRKTIQELIRGKHQCIVSEIAFDAAPIPTGASPNSSDKLAQRNLTIVESANPGMVDSHRISHTFEIIPTNVKYGSDDLMIDWGNVPAGSLATFYFSEINANNILKLAVKKYRSHRLVRIDDHTLKCEIPVLGVTYIPIPIVSMAIPAMFTIDLPSTVTKKQLFKVIVRQITSDGARWSDEGDYPLKFRCSVGSFQVSIPVHDKVELLEPEARLLSNLRWIQRSIPENNRWNPVFKRYVGHVAARVDAFGGKSNKVLPSPSGDWRSELKKCQILSLLTSILIGVFFASIGIISDSFENLFFIPAFIILIITTIFWFRRCHPQFCRILITVIIGIIIGISVLVAMILLGLNNSQLIPSLIILIVVLISMIIIFVLKRCAKQVIF
jgi:hypothetical protein